MGQAQFLYEGMTGAPAGASNVPGNLVTILDAALVNGFNSHTVSTSLIESGSVVTVVDTGHGFVNQQMVNISGATPSGFNGTFRITKVDANTYTYNPGVTGLGTATGTVTAKTPGLGWTIAFTGANQRVYQQGAGSNARYFQVDDTGSGQCVPVTCWETCSGFGTGTGQFPASVPGDGISRWCRPLNASNGSSAVGWFVIGDSKRFFLGTPLYSAGLSRFIGFFGDFTSYQAADGYNTLFASDPSGGNGATYFYGAAWPFGQYQPSRTGSYGSYQMVYDRSYDQSTASVNAGMWSAFSSNAGAAVGAYGSVYSATSSVNTVNPITTGWDLTVFDLIETDSGGSHWRRGRMPGLLTYLGNLPSPTFAGDATVDTGVATYGGIIRFTGGGAYYTNNFQIFALCDWDAM